ncbi:BTAD domain-containing putative transcriptional regulator [Streptomyces sp. NRRL B-1347]|uniref:AfsR/SARP family transcriptional regulator n=1 Tax=Streptomyces sp. NRRL B-1347 TaxID=1476877 RepID=UPI0006907F27
MAPGPERPPQQRTTAAGPLRGAPTSRAERQADAEGLRFSVLGPVRAWRGTEELPTGSPQQRALLAALLLRRGRAATASELIDALWGEEPPRQALAAMRTYATRLRKVLDLGVLASVSGGYVIRLPAGSGGLDLSTVEELWAKAERAGKAGDLKLASRRIEEALALWHGEPLANVPGPYAETQRQRLAEWRLQLQEFRLDIELQRGRQAEAVSELTALTAAHPLRERLRELLMLALYRSGRQAEALAVYADARRLLAEELGVDPSPGLQELEQRILQADAGLDTLPESPGELAAIVVRPAQLPAGVPDFTGRSDLVAELGAFLSAAGGRGRTVAAVAGIGGTGKTTLALHAAHAAASAHFPDGQLYVDLQGTEARTAEPETVLGAFLRALGTADSAIPDALEERSALYRSVLDGRRVLVVLDNARDVAQIRPLLPGAGGCATLITSRARMVDLAGAHLIDVDVMAPEEALELFARIVGEERAGAERGAALDVVAACGFLPLAIRIAASRLAARRTWTVSTLAAKLADERRRLDELQSGDLAVKATFELDYGALEPQQARAFRLLCLPDSPDISLTAAAAVLDLSVDEAEDILESLVDTSLLDSAAPGRYRYHDLVRLYARACAERDELPPARRDAALTRLLDFYGATAAGIYALDRPGSGMLRHFGHFPRHGLGFVDRAEATRWLRVEADGILACVQRSLAPTSLGRAANLLLAAADLGEPGVDPSRYESAAAAVRDAARDAGDAVAEGRAGVALIGVLLGSGRLAEARREAALALTLAESTADQGVRCWVTRDMGTIAALEGRYTEAEGHLRRGAAYFREVGDLAGEADAMLGLSEIHLATERADSAVTLARQGLDGYTRSGPTPRVAHARYRLGLALLGTHRYADAWAEFDQALQHFTANQQRLWEGTTHHRIAQVHLATRRPAPASQHAERALALGCVGGGLARADVLTTLGEALDALDQTDRARACWREALALYERAGAEGASAARDRARTLGRYLHGAGASPSRGSRDAG